MPIYCYYCPKCGNEKEEVHSVDNRYNAGNCNCGELYRIALQPVRAIGHIFSFTPHYDYQLGRHFETAEEKATYLKSKNMSQINGENSPQGKEGMRVACSKSDAKKLESGEVNPFKDRKTIQVDVK